MSTSSHTILARARGLTVEFGPTCALNDVTVEIRRGAFHMLVGENGAGKSTLLRAFAGMLSPTRGLVDIAAGIQREWVPQETGLPADLTVAEWIFLGRELRSSARLLRRAEMAREAARALERIGATFPPEQRIAELQAAQRKQVQLARSLRQNPDLLLIDEPTAVLGKDETRGLVDALRRLRDAGTAIVYVGHQLSEILALGDVVTVLRDGSLVSTDAIGDVTEELLVRRMVGRSIDEVRPSDRSIGSRILRCDKVAVAQVKDFCLAVHAGEIVGLAGLVGAGRSEVLEAIAGLRPLAGGEITTSEPPVLLPGDRLHKGLVPTLSIRENVLLAHGRGWLRPPEERRIVNQWIERLHIRTPSAEALVTDLSGGNQQKVLLARALQRGSKLLLLDEPSAGIDIGAKADIHALIRDLADDGCAIVLASSELPELLHLCDRIVALQRGRTAGVVSRRQASEEIIAELIVGTDQTISAC